MTQAARLAAVADDESGGDDDEKMSEEPPTRTGDADNIEEYAYTIQERQDPSHGEYDIKNVFPSLMDKEFANIIEK